MRRIAVVFLLLAPLVCRAAPKVPPDHELRTLARDSILAFNKSVTAQDFRSFHGFISEMWAEQITPAKLKQIFQPFIEQKADLAPIANVDPTFSPAPKIDADGVLVLQGSYPTSPSKVDFRLKYVQEKNAWKLIGIKVDVKPAGRADVPLPSEIEARAMVRESLLAFNDAIQAKSFVEFHKQIAAMWQKQTTPEKLQELFQSFIDGEIDIEVIGTLKPTFTKPIGLDEDQLLDIEGTYTATNAVIHFSLAYLYETPDWKLVKINVRVAPTDEEETPTPTPPTTKSKSGKR